VIADGLQHQLEQSIWRFHHKGCKYISFLLSEKGCRYMKRMKWSSVDSGTDVLFVYCIDVLRYNNDKSHIFSNMMKFTWKNKRK
jgi:hypothetical protein